MYNMCALGETRFSLALRIESAGSRRCRAEIERILHYLFSFDVHGWYGFLRAILGIPELLEFLGVSPLVDWDPDPVWSNRPASIILRLVACCVPDCLGCHSGGYGGTV